ncbi:FecR domain-containing protein [Tardiphaga sp.]|uniref:FecR domain-containing protein n=1 Tax=Tardiphaga sp. TaxID=1926292 RepID=UPI002A63CB3D|nr:hypothetical protein [Tardiphaga sp.]
MMSMTRHPIAGIAVSVAAMLAAGGMATAQQVGTASAVNPAATSNMRTITIGASIAHKERIQTQAGGSVQLLFIDKTSMTIGPNSDLTIDEYVFDPKANTGKLAATLGKGALRFVGGQISHNGEAEVKTASAVIGIRGGINFMTVANGETQSYTGYGSSTVSSGGSTVTLGAGEYTRTQGTGAPPVPPGLPPAGFVAMQVQSYQSAGGQSGGAPAGTATPARVASAEARATNSSTGTVAQVAPVNANGTVQVATATTSPLTTQNRQNAITSSVTQAAQTSTQSAATTEVAQEIVRQRQFSATAYALTMSNCCGTGANISSVPYLPAGFATGNSYVSPVLGYRTASVDVANRAPYFQYGIGITGEGAAQHSWFMVATGALIDDGNGGSVFSSGFGATRRGAANLGVGRASGAISSTAGSVALDEAGLPTTAQITSSYYIPESKTYVSQPATSFFGDGTPVTNYEYIQTASRIPTPADLGVNRPTVVLSGFSAGLMRSFNTTAGAFVGPSFAVGGLATVNLDANVNRMQANFDIVNLQPSTGQTFNTASYQIGTVDPSLRSRGVYVDYDNFGGREAVTVTNTTTGATLPVSTVNGRPLTGQTAIMANIPRNVAVLSGANVTFCQCDYTRWGFWSNDSYRTDANGNQIADRGNLMTWVAGRLPNISEVPTTGIATYDGHIVASVRNGANEYVAAGNFTNTVNFGTRSGAVTAGLDNTAYSGTVNLSSDPRNFSGALIGNNGGRAMAMVGQFYRGVAGPTAEMGGLATAQGNGNYMASGIFAGRMR